MDTVTIKGRTYTARKGASGRWELVNSRGKHTATLYINTACHVGTVLGEPQNWTGSECKRAGSFLARVARETEGTKALLHATERI